MSIAVYTLPFHLANVPAAQTDLPLSLAGAPGVTEIAIPWDGALVAIAVRSNEAETLGDVTARASINGLPTPPPYTAPFAQADEENTRGEAMIVAHEGCPVKANDLIGAVITTSADWAPTTADIAVVLWITIGNYEPG